MRVGGIVPLLIGMSVVGVVAVWAFRSLTTHHGLSYCYQPHHIVGTWVSQMSHHPKISDVTLKKQADIFSHVFLRTIHHFESTHHASLTKIKTHSFDCQDVTHDLEHLIGQFMKRKHGKS